MHESGVESGRMRTIRWRVLQHMPELRSQIIDRLAGDLGFQSLCQDYDQCAEALIRFREQAVPLPERVAEYERLLAELERDIREALK